MLRLVCDFQGRTTGFCFWWLPRISGATGAMAVVMVALVAQHGKIPKADAFVLVRVPAITVFTDLAIAAIVGVIVSALFFVWGDASHVADDQIA